ncbi:TPA: hypothetical protein ACIYHI_003199 [Escherichia coli]
MRDDRFNALKQEFDGAPEDTDIALLCVADMVKAACFLLDKGKVKSQCRLRNNEVVGSLAFFLKPVFVPE